MHVSNKNIGGISISFSKFKKHCINFIINLHHSFGTDKKDYTDRGLIMHSIYAPI